ncbi:MAG: hypothetical protein ACOX7R_00965 [Acetivibrionales bacterium]|jgi:hypothetical protein
MGSDTSNWVVLTNVANDIEYEIVAGILQMGNIPCVRELKGMDSYFTIITGTPIAEGIDVLVPGDRYEEAVQLLNARIEDVE